MIQKKKCQKKVLNNCHFTVYTVNSVALHIIKRINARYNERIFYLKKNLLYIYS